jgi:hypothetical protein
MADTIVYYRHANGAYSQQEVSEGSVPQAPAGAVETTAQEYAAGLAAVQEANAAAVAERAAAEREAARADYEALIAAGIPEATARRMSGYTPDPDPEQAEGGQ